MRLHTTDVKIQWGLFSNSEGGWCGVGGSILKFTPTKVCALAARLSFPRRMEIESVSHVNRKLKTTTWLRKTSVYTEPPSSDFNSDQVWQGLRMSWQWNTPQSSLQINSSPQTSSCKYYMFDFRLDLMNIIFVLSELISFLCPFLLLKVLN